MQAALRTLRVGLIIDRWQPSRGGAERALAELAQHLEARGHAVLAFAAEGPPRGESAPGQLELVRARGLAWSRGARERRLADASLAAARAARCDVTVGVRHVARVDLSWPHGGSHAASVAATRAARAWRADLPTRIERTRFEAGRLAGRHRAFVEIEREAFSARGARAIACVSKLVMRELASEFPEATDRLVLVENGVDLERFSRRDRAARGLELRRALAIPPSTPIIAFAARNPELKGLPVLRAALARLAARPWVLVAAGSRRANVSELAADRVRVLRDVDTAALFAAADVCAAPTWRDTSGLTVLEALACGTPVITTSCAGAADAISAESGDVLERSGDVDALTAALERWLDRAARDEIDRDVIRACVADRGRDAWLARIEALLMGLAS